MSSYQGNLDVTAAPARPDPGSGSADLPLALNWAALVSAWVAAGLLLLWLRQDIAYSVDEFDWISTAGTDSFRELITPTNGHLTLVPFLIFKASLHAFGTNAQAFTFIEIAFLGLVSAGIYVFSKERIGPTLALAPAVVPLFLGASWPMLLASMIAILWCCPIAFGLWALLAESRDGGRAYDVAACVLLMLSVASFTVGLAFAAACAVSILLKPNRRRRIWIAAIPILAYGVWYVWARQFGASAIDLANLLWLPAYVIDAISGAIMATFGRNLPYGPATSLHLSGFDLDRLMLALLVAVVEVAVVTWAVLRRVKIGNLAALWPVVTIAAVWWVSQDLVLGLYRSPVEFRYLYWGAIVVLLLAVELARGVNPSRRPTAAVLVLVLLAIACNMPRFQDGHSALAALTQEARADMAVLELAGDNADPGYVLNGDPLTPQTPFIFLTTGLYLETVERFGSPAYSLEELARQPEATRQAADEVLARSMLLGLVPAPESGVRHCRQVKAAAGEASVSAIIPPNGAVLETQRTRRLTLGRFAAGQAFVLGEIAPESPALLKIPRDPSSVPWRISATGASPFTVCALGRAQAESRR